MASFHDVEYVSSVRLKFSVHDICKLWSHYSHCKHDLHDYIVELFDEYPAPFSPEMTMIVIDYDTNNDVISMETETPKLAVEGNRFWSRSGHWN